MKIDSFMFLPRSFRERYAAPVRVEGEDEPVWADFEPRLADATIGLVTSAGLYVRGEQASFDLDGERENPYWGDPGWRRIPQSVAQGRLGMAHLHVNNADVLADHGIALPTAALDDLVAAGTAGAAAAEHVSVMGYQEKGLEVWRGETAPAVVEHLRGQGVDGVVLAPV